jgi:hypothetical protein
MSVLALALKRLALSQRDNPNAVPPGQALEAEPSGTNGTNGTVRTDRTAGAFHDHERCCFICGHPSSFGFGVFLREARQGRWTCAVHRP